MVCFNYLRQEVFKERNNWIGIIFYWIESALYAPKLARILKTVFEIWGKG